MLSLTEAELRWCRTCGEVLNVWQQFAGKSYLHAGQRPNRPHDHPAVPVRLEDLDRPPVSRCDVCFDPSARWVYHGDGQLAHDRQIVEEHVRGGDYAARHGAARVSRTVTEHRQTNIIGERWSVCDECAALVEHRDLLGLMARGIAGMPTRPTGKRLIRARGELHGLYGHVLDTLKPGRGRITPGHPLGIWDDPPTTAPTPQHGSTDSTATPRRGLDAGATGPGLIDVETEQA